MELLRAGVPWGNLFWMGAVTEVFHLIMMMVMMVVVAVMMVMMMIMMIRQGVNLLPYSIYLAPTFVFENYNSFSGPPR